MIENVLSQISKLRSARTTFLIFEICFVLRSDPYVKLSLYVADENRELALVQTKTIKKVGPDGGGGVALCLQHNDVLICVCVCVSSRLVFRRFVFLTGLFRHV